MKGNILKIFIIYFIFLSLIFSQDMKKRSGLSKGLREIRELKRMMTIIKANERSGNYRSALIYYDRLLPKFEKNFDVLSGYVNASIATQRIRECEIYLKKLISDNPLSDNYTETLDTESIYPLYLRALLSELFFRTSRPELAYQVFSLIRDSNAPDEIKNELKAGVFLRSGMHERSKELFLEIRKSKNNNDLYAHQLYKNYLALKEIKQAVLELLKLLDSPEYGSADKMEGFHPESELFRLYEIGEFSKDVINTFKNNADSDKKRLLLSRLYFNSGDYELSFSTLQDNKNDKESYYSALEFAEKLYFEKKFTQASKFYMIAFRNPKLTKNQEVTERYLRSVETSGSFGDYKEAVLNSKVENGKLYLARYYHNRSGRLKEALKIYNSELPGKKRVSEFYLDQIRLLVGQGNYEKAYDMLDSAMIGNMDDVIRKGLIPEYMYIDAVLELLRGNKDEFTEAANELIGDNTPTDTDNDILMIINDLDIAGEDEDVFNNYVKIIRYFIDPPSGIKNIKTDIKTDDPEKMKLVSWMELVYYISEKNNGKINKIIKNAVEKKIVTNRLISYFISFLNDVKERSDIKKFSDQMLELLRTDIDEQLKTQIREIIREEQLL